MITPQAKQNAKMQLHFFFALMVLAVVMTMMAQAGTDTTFDTWATEMEDWLTGSFGKSVSLAVVVVGMVGAVMRQSLMPLAVGVGAALGMNYAPPIIDGMFTAIL
ncbi:pili assembly chaperone [Vibrio aestuarianus subsp. cardii]|uniref:TraA family conjugative transfer protein n=1 Tax=Vibrio aestuarianus TaxID=28171 RepID=UPI0015C52226|nr:TraA family conjugative transfer protein [Vibrio aestuarianus]NGZ66616.1 pili assembly chaperone [Vibrio aestuarianus subsp. cardii]